MQPTGGATIDPPAADVARKARERRDALLNRLDEERELRTEKHNHLEMMLAENAADIVETTGQVVIIPII